MPVTPDLLRLVPLFNGMTDRSFQAIADLASEADYATSDKPMPRSRVMPQDGGPITGDC